MPLFPSFRRPCPYQADLAAVMDGSWCRKCGQQVHDITDWTDAERAALVRGCAGEVCVSYRVPVTALAAAALVASSTPAVAAPKPKHHATRPVPPQPPVITLAGAPMLAPPEPTVSPTPDGPPPNSITPPAGLRSSR